MALIFFFVLFSCVFLFYQLYYKRQKLPPGPFPLPFLGNLLQLHRYGNAEDVFLQWRRQFGPMYTFWMGQIPVVCVAEYAKIVDTFVRDGETYAGRYTMPFEHVFRGEDIHGVISSSGERWREQRRFALHVLKDFGLGKNLMQERIMLELGAMFGKIDAKSGSIDEVNVPELIDVAVGSIINNLMFGYRFEGGKEREFWDLKQSMDELRNFGSPITMIWLCYPRLLGRVPPFSAVAGQIKRRMDNVFGFFESRITEHQRELDKCGDWEAPPKDFVEAFLKEMKRKNEHIKMDTFSICSNALICALTCGSPDKKPTAKVLAWGVAQLLNNENCLNKLYAELDTVIGTDRLVSVADRPNLPYTNAVINETLRVANILPNNVLHALTREVTVDGFKLPKGTAIVPQVSAVLIDDAVFSEPKRFKPERFLEQNGTMSLARCDELIPFSIGKRQCLGESMARMELFLFIANIFNQYKVSPGQTVPSLQRNKDAVVHCSPFTCRMEKRKVSLE
uniref:Unspecific monooxygenase n=1 Tax=Globodera rostochiensis TaxID=31243 RepID=A0A914HQN8_GLORO